MANSIPPLEDTGSFRVARRPQGFGRLLESIMYVGRGLLGRARRDAGVDAHPAALETLCRQLLDHRGQASGLALADEILRSYQALSAADRLDFFERLSEHLGPDHDSILESAETYRREPNFETLTALEKAIEAPRQKLFRRLNMVPNGTSRLVQMRGELLEIMRDRPDLRALDSDLRHLLIAWFNRGFLAMDRIDWSSPANVLEKIIAYEAVHEINGWEDLRARLAEDRRCFAFFHPAMPDDPLIFVEVALTEGISKAIGPLISAERAISDPRTMNTAVFYSISNCHTGLRGINFGHFLIKQVVEELRRDLDNVKHFATLSPVPGFRRWIANTSEEAVPAPVSTDLGEARHALELAGAFEPRAASEEVRALLMRLCAYYLLHAKNEREPQDPVARFHLSNGASLTQINWEADGSATGLEQSAGIMVNYIYDPDEIEKNHELYFAQGEVSASASVRKLLALR